MTNTLARRAFTTSMLAGPGAAALPSRSPAQSRKLRIGRTSPGYHKAETFAAILEDWDTKGTLKDLLASHPIPLISKAYPQKPGYTFPTT
jgi:hypothetical protein